MDGNSCNVFMRSLKANELGIPGRWHVLCVVFEMLQFLITAADFSLADVMCQNNNRKLLYISTNLCFINRLSRVRWVSEQFCLFLLFKFL